MKLALYLIILIAFTIASFRTQGVKRAISILFLAYVLGFGIYTFAVI